MIRVSVFTGTRAEYGLLYWLIKALDENASFDLQLIVTGSHLSHEYGFTVNEIMKDGFCPKESIPCLISSDEPGAITKSMALLSISMSDYFAREKPDCLVVLGDRFEILAASQAALIAKVPIVHLHGGEVTEGAVDEKIRHAVTKLSSLHFTSTDSYSRRVIQMGVKPGRVFNCGALGVESIHKYDLLEKKDLEKVSSIDLGEKFFLVVYHPETYKDSADVEGLLKALSCYPGYNKVIIYPNADMMSREIILAINDYKNNNPLIVELLQSVSHLYYLSLLKHCSALIGNSSSGIIEAPSFKAPTVNIGGRQQGRLRSSAIIDVGVDSESIANGIKQALSIEHKESLERCDNPYDAGVVASNVIIDELYKIKDLAFIDESFYDLEFDI